MELRFQNCRHWEQPNYERYFNPEEAHEYVPKIVGLLERNDLAYIVSFFQQVRTGPDCTFEWYLSAARVLLQSQTGQPLLIICLSCPVDPKSHMTAKVQRLLDENNFLQQNASTFSLVTRREREVLQYLALGYSSPEIADMLHMSVQTTTLPPPQHPQKAQRNFRFRVGSIRSSFQLNLAPMHYYHNTIKLVLSDTVNRPIFAPIPLPTNYRFACYSLTLVLLKARHSPATPA